MGTEERVAVKTYVPRYQKERWASHADALDMSQSEFVRTMVQAGRRDFDVPPEPGVPNTESSVTPETDVRDRIMSELTNGDTVSWDELLDALVGDVEAEAQRIIDELQDENVIRFDPRNGGFRLRNHE